MKPIVASALIAGLSTQAETSDGLNRFATAVYDRLAAETKGNLFFSPYSLHAAMTMAAAGAKGGTERQLADLLGGGATADERNAAAKALADALRAAQKDGAVTLDVANRAWVQKDFKVLDAYQATLRERFDSAFVPADIRGGTDGVRREINGWVEERTRDKIRNLIGPGALTPDTLLVLVNAIYFHGSWTKAFDPKLTQDAPFHLADGGTVTAPLMFRKVGNARYAEGDGFQSLELPYKGDRLAMLVLLPPAGGLASLEARLAREGLAPFLPGRFRDVLVWLPRFKSSGSFELAGTLAKMGAGDAFSGRADFSGITGRKELTISAVIHKAVVDVNEEGTEAAAATAVMMQRTSVIVRPDPPPQFRADRPFVYAILDRETKAVLFLGRLANPAAP